MTDRRPTLAELRARVAFELDGEWQSISAMRRRLGLGGSEWYRLALVLERLVVDGDAEIQTTPGGHVRRFRWRQEPS